MNTKRLKKTNSLVVGIALTFFTLPALAGKVDQVKASVKSTCNKDLPESDLMDAVLKAYDCTAGTEVKVADCKIKCLKENSGSVVGK